jgi:hypothetical protein
MFKSKKNPEIPTEIHYFSPSLRAPAGPSTAPSGSKKQCARRCCGGGLGTDTATISTKKNVEIWGLTHLDSMKICEIIKKMTFM